MQAEDVAHARSKRVWAMDSAPTVLGAVALLLLVPLYVLPLNAGLPSIWWVVALAAGALLLGGVAVERPRWRTQVFAGTGIATGALAILLAGLWLVTVLSSALGNFGCHSCGSESRSVLHMLTSRAG
jgi:hypothetical protein